MIRRHIMKHPYLAMILLAGGLFACGKKVPGDVIQPEAMENLLYDYHLASTIGNNQSGTDAQKREAYYEYVFKKHQVTEAEFDSSMVWYTRHTEELSRIYENLQKRYESAELAVRKQVDRQSGQISVSMSGDTVDIWRDRSIYWLTSSPLTNKIVFNLKADTTFRPKDVLVLQANFSFLPVKNRGKAVMGLNLSFKNDSVQGLTRMVTPGTQRLYFQPDSAFEFKEITGFIYYESGQTDKTHVLVSDIHLHRYHVKETVTDSLTFSSADTIRVDSARTDTISRRLKRIKELPSQERGLKPVAR